MDLNDTVSVELTQKGADILNAKNEKIKEKYPKIFFRTDYRAGDLYFSELWEIFYLFGAACSMGAAHPFVDLKLIKSN